ncbi:hypothetical protein R1flu_009549 [Riccia fluitans]|uniref:Clathrin light chain n=1 Tax=Riccia fluitans TaxID=41844 RepID=A0ABD1Z5F6_9MARC
MKDGFTLLIGKQGKNVGPTPVESANPYVSLDIDQPEVEAQDEHVFSAEPLVIEGNQNMDRDSNVSAQQTFLAIEKEQQTAEMDSAKEKRKWEEDLARWNASLQNGSQSEEQTGNKEQLALIPPTIPLANVVRLRVAKLGGGKGQKIPPSK